MTRDSFTFFESKLKLKNVSQRVGVSGNNSTAKI